MIPDHVVTITDGVADIQFDVIAKVEDADYEWSAEAILRRQVDGALFYFSDSGCSCTYFAESATVADLTLVHKVEEAYRIAHDRQNLKHSFETGEEVWR